MQSSSLTRSWVLARVSNKIIIESLSHDITTYYFELSEELEIFLLALSTLELSFSKEDLTASGMGSANIFY
jgi:hypothetical protein